MTPFRKESNFFGSFLERYGYGFWFRVKDTITCLINEPGSNFVYHLYVFDAPENFNAKNCNKKVRCRCRKVLMRNVERRFLDLKGFEKLSGRDDVCKAFEKAKNQAIQEKQ